MTARCCSPLRLQQQTRNSTFPKLWHTDEDRWRTVYVLILSLQENTNSLANAERVLTLWRAAMLALLSMRSEVRTGRSILTPSSASSPPPSWIHSRAKRVAAAACSSPLPGSDTHSSFSWFIRFYFLLRIRLKCFQSTVEGLTFFEASLKAVTDGEASL